MSKKQLNDGMGGFFLLLLLLLLAPFILKGMFAPLQSDRDLCNDRVFVQISGSIRHPGVYGFLAPPDLAGLIIRAGGLTSKTVKHLPSEAKSILCHSGVNIDLRSHEKGIHIFKSEMSAFYRMTFGIPISLNKETVEGLTAVPGIGPKIASAIVRERSKRGGFQQLDEIMCIQGIGPKFLNKISPYLVL